MAEQSSDGPIRKLVYLIEGDDKPFEVKVAANERIFGLRQIIYNYNGVNALILAKDLKLWKVTTTQSPA